MKTNKGFTLIELLVVISIIGLLATLLLANFNAARLRARNATRQSDIKQYQTSLGEYASEHNGLYIVEANRVNICDITTDLSLTSCIDDPQSDTGSHYQYISNSTGTAYALSAQLETDNGTDSWWILCSSGLVGETATALVSSGYTICPL